jgi:uncharacterized GH25 family protein
MTKCTTGCWYHDQGFERCPRLDGCIEAATSDRAHRVWVCPSCRKEMTASSQVETVLCHHGMGRTQHMRVKDPDAA